MKLIHMPPINVGDGVIVDLGANIGITAEAYALKYIDNQIIAVEPDHSNAESLRSRLSQFGDRATVVEAAIWIEDGFVQFFPGLHNETGFVSGTNNFPTVVQPIKVPSITLDTLLQDVELVEFIKFDIECSEFPVIALGGEWVNKTRALIVEYHDTSSQWAKRLILDRGFSIVREETELLWAVR